MSLRSVSAVLRRGAVVVVSRSSPASAITAPSAIRIDDGRRFASNNSAKNKKSPAAAAAAAATATDIGEDAASNAPSYFERKQARKQEKIQRYQATLDRAVALKTRRNKEKEKNDSMIENAPTKKTEFEGWWKAKLVREQKWDRQARQQGKAWKIQVAALVERLPQVLPDMEDFETDFEELQAYLAQFGKDYPKEFSSPKIPKDGTAPVSMEELLGFLPEGFQLAPRETKADESGQTDTLDRKLKTSVYLMVNGGFPTTAVTLTDTEQQEQESLLEAAKRAVQDVGGKELELYCPSQAPVAVHMTKNENGDDDDSSSYFGTKTFFLRLQYDDGSIRPSGENAKEVAWLDRSEIVELNSSRGDVDDEAKFYRYLL